MIEVRPCSPRTGPRARVAGALAAVAAAWALAGAPARGAAAAEPTPDFAFFREKIEPVLQRVCAECHAGKGKGQFALVVRAVGVPLSETESRANFATVSKLLVPGKPEQSKFLLKPLAERDGGVKHEGGDRIFKGTAAYRAWVEFITGTKGVAPAAGSAPGTTMSAPPPSAPGQPDLGFFVAHVEPVLLNVCAQCHAGVGKGAFGLVVHTGGARFPLADHQRNFDTVVRLLVPGKPEQSKFLLKPLAERDGGVKHGGGDRIAKGDPNYAYWVAFITGEKGPPPPTDAAPEPELPTVLDKGLTLRADAAVIEGDASAAAVEGAQGQALVPGPGGGRATLRFRASRRADYTLSFHAQAAPSGFRVRVDDGEFLEVLPPRDGWADVSPVLPLDGGKPLDGRLGGLALVDADGTAALAMDGREGMARWLSPADLPHTRVEATVSVPDDDQPGRDDAWLLFDCLDRENGKFFGLIDGGRKVAMGVIEGGRPRIVRTAPAPAGLGGAKAFRLGVDLTDGVAVGRVDGKPILFVNFDRALGAARFGFLTHGTATVTSLVARRGTEEVHRTRFGSGGVLHLAKGNHTLEIALLPHGAAVDAVTVKEASAP